MVCELRMGHPGNKSIADTFLVARWTVALPLWLPIGWELPEECIAACLWKAEASTSSSLVAAQSGDCFESEEKGDGTRMQTEAHNSGFLQCFFLSLSLAANLARLLSIIQASTGPSSPFSPSHVQLALPCLLHICDRPRMRARGKSGSPEDVTCLTLTRLRIKKRRDPSPS